MGKSNRLVSIMMPVYNGEKFIAKAIDSVLYQSYREWELIIVNDGSTDRTLEIIESYTDPRIRYFFQENMGEASARNLALTKLRGELVAFLDSDDQYLSCHLNDSINYLKMSPKFDAVYTDGYHIDVGGNRHSKLSRNRSGPYEGNLFNYVVRASDVFGPPVCVVLDHDVIKNNHLSFDTRIVIGPDWDFLTQYAEVGTFGYLYKPTCLYRVHESNISITTSSQLRKSSLAQCRENAIKRTNFHLCSIGTRAYVFYDLLINLLPGDFSRQNDITKWLEFADLPYAEQARLYRLMAVEALLQEGNSKHLEEWLRKAFALNPSDFRNAFLFYSYSIQPDLSRRLFRLRRVFHRKKPSM